MNDLISRQALCEYALNQKDKSVTPNDIMRFPSAQLGWIPCDKAVPAENGRYLCTNTAWGAYITDWDVWVNGSWLHPDDEHIAWMPMPEPYQKED